LHKLEGDRKSIEVTLVETNNSRLSLNALPEIIPDLVGAQREIVDGMTGFSSSLYTRASDVQAVGDRLHVLLDPVVPEPREGGLWAHPSETQKASSKRGLLVGYISIAKSW
jgi:hypothetical protein